MPSIKIYPPNQLPDRNVTETQFSIWAEELEVYLSQEEDFAQFLPEGIYSTWQSKETNPDRIAQLHNEDMPDPNTAASRAAKLRNVRTKLRTVLAIIGKCVSEGHYNNVIRHSTSLGWIYETLRSDYDIQKRGIHFFNILEVKFDANVDTPVSYYNKYRTVIVNNLSKTGDIIKYKGNNAITEDERMTPMLEDLILLNVLQGIDSRLPGFIKMHYNHKMKHDDKLMDLKSDILVNTNAFLEQINCEEQNNSLKAAALGAFRQQANSKFNRRRQAIQRRSSENKKLYCRLCYLEKMPKEIFLSHNLGDKKCSSMSNQNKGSFNDGNKFSNIKQENVCDAEDEQAEMFGYSGNYDQNYSTDEVVAINKADNLNDTSRSDAQLHFIQPVPSQILTVFRNIDNTEPIHIDLDSGATLNYCSEQEVLKRGFTLYPNCQKSKLGDGITSISAVGEIHEIFFRNKVRIIFNAVVCKNLTSPYIGGTLFLKENTVEQDLAKNVIYLDGRQTTIQPTDQVSILPTQPLISTIQVTKNNPSKNVTFQRRTLMPGQTYKIPVKQKDGDIIAIEPHEMNDYTDWPVPQLQIVDNGTVSIKNETNNPMLLGSQIKLCKMTMTTDPTPQNEAYYKYNDKLGSDCGNGYSNTKLISHNREVCVDANNLIDHTHKQYHSVFDKDLSNGYNGFYGHHECYLNWASEERPPASKVKIPSYDHSLKGLQQELMDELTRQNVLLVPQDHGINVQAVCPSFLQRKQKAKSKPKQDLTKDDVRLLINFGPLNSKIKPVPIHVPKAEDLIIKLGRWKFIIIFDLYSGYFQNHMAKEAIPWMGVQTPFGGLRVVARSGQGLMGMAEEFDELLAKILKEELMEGICDKIVDDVVIGGTTPLETAQNYARVLQKLDNANIKVAPEKTKIFPKSADMLGWVWEQGGFLSASPHRKLGITNTRIEDIKTVKDMRSWIGLFKTLHIVTPNITNILEPFEVETAGRDTNDKFYWTHELETMFRQAKKKIDNQVKLYLPAPEDQLIMETDAAKGSHKLEQPSGIGHVIFALKDNVKLPVRIHSTKLPDKCRKWSPCEVEALAFAAGIDKEYDLIRESNHPLIICPDSKPVHEAVKRINEGKFSTSARMSSFLTNVNRTPIISKHISGKAKLNPIPDLQSRYPPNCQAEHCSIHKFLEDTIDSTMDTGAKNCSIDADNSFNNREAWKTAQLGNQACMIAKQLLISGKPPPKAIGRTTGEFYNDVRQYCRDASIAADGTLVVKTTPDILSGNIARQRIVVPKPLVPALLYHLHNHNNAHPTKSQQKQIFQRQFYAIHLDKHLDILYRNCYQCAVIQKIPKQNIPSQTKTVVDGPATHFHADVIKRAGQIILTIRDHFSSLQDAIIIESEKSQVLKNGLIMPKNAPNQ